MSPRPTQNLEPRLREAASPVVERAGLVLENLTVANGGRKVVVRIIVDLPDGPGGVGSEALTAVSRDLSAMLDDADLVPGAYTMEVSTPGVDRPLTTPRHFRRAVGRLVAIEPSAQGEEKFTGRVVDADEDVVRLTIDGREQEVPHSAIAKARVEVELKRSS